MKKTVYFLGVVLTVCATALAQDVPRVETFAGFTYLWASTSKGAPNFKANGGSGQFVVNAGRSFGFVADLGAVHNGSFAGYQIDSTITNFLFGPRIPIRKWSRVIPYGQVLVGGVYMSQSAHIRVPEGTVPPPVIVNPIAPPVTRNDIPAVTARATASQTAFAMAVGGGLDIKLSKYVTFRPIGLDWFMTRLQNFRTLNDSNQHNLRYTTGLNFTFGHEAPAPALPVRAMKTCWDGSSVPADTECPNREMTFGLSAANAEICPEASVSIVPGVGIPEGARRQWTVNGEPTSEGETFDFGAAGRAPGTYKIGLTSTAPGYNPGSAVVSITVLPYQPPSGRLEVSPSEIWVGERATVAAEFKPGQCGGPLSTPVISAAEGSVTENQFDSSAVQFDPSDNSEQRKTVRLQATVRDEKGAGNADATVVVKRKAVISATRLPDIVFPAGSARVNNCGKRVLLEELRAFTQRDPGGQVVLVGHVSSKETASGSLDLERALNAAAVISAGTGICASLPANQISLAAVGASDNGVDFQPQFCGTSAIPQTPERRGQTINDSVEEAKFRRVEVWFVPAGGNMPVSAKDYQSASTLPVSRLGCPK